MRRILYLTPGAEPDGAAAQIALLCRGLPPEQFQARVCVLGGLDQLGPALRTARAPLSALGGPRLFDPRPLWRLRRLVRDFRPDLIHAFRPASLRALALAVGRPPCPLVVSRPLGPRRRGYREVSRLDRWLLGRAARVVADGDAGADRCLRAGLAPAQVVVIPPGVELPREGAATGPPVAEADDLARAVLCAGRLEPHKGYRDAIWALDVLRILFEDLRLVLAGAGPERPRLERFARRICVTEHLRFAGPQADVARLMAIAQAVLVPSLADGGVRVALEAMAAGRPVVGTRLPGLTEVVAEGETGYLVPPGDKIALARRVRRLLLDEGLRRQLGQAGRERVARHFSARVAVANTVALYRELAA